MSYNKFFGLLLVVLAYATVSVSGQGVKKAKGSRRGPSDDEEKVKHKFPVMYSLDNEKWEAKGHIVVGEMYHVWFEAAFKEWDEGVVGGLVGGEYYLKIAGEAGEGYGAASFTNPIQIAVSVCELVNSAFSEHYNVVFSPHTDEKLRIVGVSPFGAAYTKTRAPALDACAVENLHPRYDALKELEGASLFTHSVVVADRPPQRPATFGPNTKDEPIYQQPQNAQAKREQTRARVERGEEVEEAEKPEKTWFEKYWLYIVVGIMILRLQGPAEPQQGAAAPAAKK